MQNWFTSCIPIIRLTTNLRPLGQGMLGIERGKGKPTALHYLEVLTHTTPHRPEDLFPLYPSPSGKVFRIPLQLGFTNPHPHPCPQSISDWPEHLQSRSLKNRRKTEKPKTRIQAFNPMPPPVSFLVLWVFFPALTKYYRVRIYRKTGGSRGSPPSRCTPGCLRLP